MVLQGTTRHSELRVQKRIMGHLRKDSSVIDVCTTSSNTSSFFTSSFNVLYLLTRSIKLNYHLLFLVCARQRYHKTGFSVVCCCRVLAVTKCSGLTKCSDLTTDCCKLCLPLVLIVLFIETVSMIEIS